MADKRRDIQKPKRLIGLNQNGKWPRTDARTSSVADDEPPAKRPDLTHPKVLPWNVVNPKLPLTTEKASRKVS